MEEEYVSVNCHFCNASFESPKSMLSAEYHVCQECAMNKIDEIDMLPKGKAHIDFPPEMTLIAIVEQLVEDEFDVVWRKAKHDSKDLSKKELAKDMFSAGAGKLLQKMMELEEEDYLSKNSVRD